VADLLAEGEPRQAEAARLLRAWNHRFDPDQAGAAVWTALWPRLVHRVGETVLDSFTAQLGAGNAGRLTRHLVLGGEAPSFFAADLAQLTGEAAETAMVYLSQALGADSATWSWERAQRLALCHPLSRCDAARRVFDPPVVRCAGGTGVVNNRSSRETPTGFEVSGGPSYRFGADLSESGGHGALLAGQSAQPGHRHYHDQLELWTQGRLHELPMLAEEIDSRRQSTTRLEPGPKDGRAD
jgi:acyl-homoserine lactone acylase PvdQ